MKISDKHVFANWHDHASKDYLVERRSKPRNERWKLTFWIPLMIFIAGVVLWRVL